MCGQWLLYWTAKILYNSLMRMQITGGRPDARLRLGLPQPLVSP